MHCALGKKKLQLIEFTYCKQHSSKKFQGGKIKRPNSESVLKTPLDVLRHVCKHGKSEERKHMLFCQASAQTKLGKQEGFYNIV